LLVAIFNRSADAACMLLDMR